MELSRYVIGSPHKVEPTLHDLASNHQAQTQAKHIDKLSLLQLYTLPHKMREQL